MILFRRFVPLFIGLMTTLAGATQMRDLIFNAGKYQLYRDSLVQGTYVARALSIRELISNYESPENHFKSARITFKFSINGKDNEMPSGIDHQFVCMANDGHCETPIIKFGTPLKDPAAENVYLEPNTLLTIRVDMRGLLEQFKTKGYYTTYSGEKIYKEDFKGVFVAGNTSPLIWDFDNLVNHPQLQLKDVKGDGIYQVSLLMNNSLEKKGTAASWKMTRDVSAFPSYASGIVISDALYNLALEEMVNAVEPDSTFRTGKEWAGVWTRDISYSIILSMAHLQPAVAKNSLLRKVNAAKKIIQDTGTGGAWPVSTDRMIWAVAAWELYKVTGDKDWLLDAYTIIKNSIDDDLHTIYDPITGLVKGESSFLDWREQTYPKWMQPADIAESECLGTNAVHYRALTVLGKMAIALQHPDIAATYQARADKIKKGINTYLWLEDRKYYGQFLYGRNNKIVSPKSEALGEALCVLFDIADHERQKLLIKHVPVNDFGIPCIFPTIPGIPPYHNNAVWPFVQSYWLWASAKAGNERSVMESVSAIYRPAAMFLTNKENFVAENGDFSGTQINSSNMLWSLSGSISIVHHVFFGIRYQEASLTFEPFVPKELASDRTLQNFRYRDALLNIEMKGFGNKIKHFYLDGKEQAKPTIASSMKGTHTIRIVLNDMQGDQEPINKTVVHTGLPTPVVHFQHGQFSWERQESAFAYKVLKNGKLIKTTKENGLPVAGNRFSEYQVIAVDQQGYESFASEPLSVWPKQNTKIIEVEDQANKANYPYNGYTGSGFVEISTSENKNLELLADVEKDGNYAIDFRYANGNGPTNTENKCAIRTLKIDGRDVGTVLFPQRGKDEWSNWGYSNINQVFLTKGKHRVALVYNVWNDNMNVRINQAMVDHLRITKL